MRGDEGGDGRKESVDATNKNGPAGFFKGTVGDRDRANDINGRFPVNLIVPAVRSDAVREGRRRWEAGSGRQSKVSDSSWKLHAKRMRSWLRGLGGGCQEILPLLYVRGQDGARTGG